MSDPVRQERVHAHRENARGRGVKPDAVVDEDAHEDGHLVERIAQRDHPHTDDGKRATSHLAARIPPQPAHVWILVLLVTFLGVLLSWWGTTY